MQWTGERNGEYRATFVPSEQGVYEARVEASRTGTTLGADVGHIRVAPSDSEFFDAAMRAPLLQRIAQDTGGRFYTSANVAALAEDVKYTGRGVTTVEERDLVGHARAPPAAAGPCPWRMDLSARETTGIQNGLDAEGRRRRELLARSAVMHIDETPDLQADEVALADRMKHGRDQIVTEMQKLIIGQSEVVRKCCSRSSSAATA